MKQLNNDTNIVLIGMPGVGKSTVGVLLAKVLSMNFMDTDVYIQARQGERLQDIIDARGLDVFCRIEEENILSLNCRGFVLATGGSVVYSDRAMKHLSASGTIVHLDLDFDVLEKRINDLGSRGVVMKHGQSLNDLFNERQPLYKKHAEVTVDCKERNHEEVVSAIAKSFK